MDDNSDLFSAMPEQPKASRFPKSLSHYTSLDGFLSIIQNNTIRASNILFLNDKEEMQYGIDVAKEVVKEIELRSPPPAIPGRTANPREIPDVYACCFCEETDMLSQWRGYGSASQSVSIQFRLDDLRTLARSHDFDLESVVYGKKHAIDLLRINLAAAEPTAKLFRAILEDPGLDAYDVRRSRILSLAPRFKNDAFAEEREWRIIAKAHVVKQVEYRVRDNVIMPYVNIANKTTGLPISRVTIGPGKDAALTRKSVEKFLSQTQFYNNVEVALSGIPFRT